jgi:type II secretory pathway pseudopilin PulG
VDSTVKCNPVFINKPSAAKKRRLNAGAVAWYRLQHGITYIEIMITLTLLAIIAGVALPNLANNDSRKLDVAAAEVAQAIRFTRLEAMRTTSSKGIVFDAINETVKVYSLPGLIPVYDVYHPVDKKPYALNFKTDTAISRVDLQSYSIYYAGSGINQPYIGFNASGNPKYGFFGLDYMLSSTATITLAYAGKTRVISVAPMTGRVTVQ